MTIREETSSILGVRIDPGTWEKSINYIDTAGMYTRRKQMELTIMILRKLEEIEQKEQDGKSK